ncbi:MAG: hypothetical protein ACI8RZ_001179 [Myxococcota bacterium]|jgi:hypothetical protein
MFTELHISLILWRWAWWVPRLYPRDISDDRATKLQQEVNFSVIEFQELPTDCA